MFFDPPRTIAFWLINGIPAAVLTIVIVAMIQPAIWVAAGFAGIINAAAWMAWARRRSSLPLPKTFVGS